MSMPGCERVFMYFEGAAVNLLMPVVLLSGFFVIRGFPYPAYLDNPVVISGLPKNSPLAGAGVSDGDHLGAINDAATPNWSKVSTILQQIPPDGPLPLSVDPQGAQRIIEAKATDLRSEDAP